jgi:ferric-dicitrate binding protein FerR (iron transport regulator)/TolA-binding protein
MSDKAPPKRWLESNDPKDARARALLEGFDDAPPRGAEARVWRALESKESRSSVRPFALAAVGLAAAAAGVFIAQRPKTEKSFAEIASVDGSVLFSSDRSELRPAIEGQGLAAGARVETRADAKGVVRLAGGVDLELPPATELSLIEAGEHLHVSLARGSVRAIVTKRAPSRSFAVIAGQWTATAIGTRYEVERIGESDVEVRVEEGIVLVEGPGVSERVTAGGRFRSEKVAEIEPPKAAAPLVEARAIEETPEEIAPERRPRKERRAPKAAKAKTFDTKRSPIEETWPVEEAKPPRPVRALEPTPAPQPAPAPETKPTSEPVAEKPSALTPAIPAPAPRPSDEQLYREAREEREPARAIRLFDKIAEGQGPYAEVSSHQAARLAMHLGKFGDAAQRNEALLARYPRSGFAQEARLNLIECRIRSGEIDRASKELDRFLTVHPDSERRPELRFLRAELARQRGRCKDAIADYRAAMSSRHADDATYFAAWCVIEIGDREAGERALEQYLDRFPKGRHAAQARRGISSEKIQ